MHTLQLKIDDSIFEKYITEQDTSHKAQIKTLNEMPQRCRKSY